MSILRIAELTGVSPATVSRVFNRPEQVSEPTRALVIRVASETGYRPNSAARTLRTHRSYVIGVLLPTLRNPVFAECLEGIAQKALEAGYGIMPISSGYEADEERRVVSTLLAANVDGMILTVTDPEDCPVLADLSRSHVPYVLAYNRSPRHVCVGVNSESEVAAVVLKLVSNGHCRIAMLSGHLAASDRARSRYQGYLDGMSRAGLAPMSLIEVPFMSEDDHTIHMVLAKSTQRPTAVICSNDLLALRFIRCARGLGLSVPCDISVVGFDGISVSAEVCPALTTVVQPSSAIGRRAAELVMAQINGDLIAAGSEPPMPCSFREGETVRALG